MTLRKARDLYPDKVAVVDGDRSITYARMGERVHSLARFFQDRAIRPQDRISILEVNSLAFLETYYAAAGVGAILNPLNYRLAPKEIAFILRDSGSRWLVTGSRFASLVKGILDEDLVKKKTKSITSIIVCRILPPSVPYEKFYLYNYYY